MKKRKVKLIIGIVCLLMCLILFLPFPVNRTYTAIEIKVGDPSYLQTVSVKCKGWYCLNVIRPDTYSGTVSIVDKDVTSKTLVGLNTNGVLKPFYQHKTDPPSDALIGGITCTRYLHNILIYETEENWANNDLLQEGNTFIITNIQDYESAITILEQFTNYQKVTTGEK